MSALAGRVNLDGRPVEEGPLRRMLEVQHNRGPGSKRIWIKGNVGAGHAALSLADRTVYPFVSEDAGIALVADARLDNRDELASLLDTPVPPDQDGPLLLAAYRRWGSDCCLHLRGDFAFVLWDAREQRLFGARDHFGVRSLFYHHAPGRHFAFSSEIKGFWQWSDIPKKLDEVRLVEAIQMADTDAARTMFEGIRGVPAGHTFTLSARGLQFSRYWAPEAGDDWQAPNDAAYAEELRARFMTAIERRLRGTDAVAAELSGGLDSSSIACAARDIRRAHNGPPLDTLSLRYPEFPEADEGSYIEAVLAGGHFNPHYMNGGGRSTLTDIERVFERIDDPSLVAANHHHVWMRFELAAECGMKAVLTGHDGDTIVGHGFERYYELARAGEWETFRAEAARFEQRMHEAGSGPEDQIYLSFAAYTFGQTNDKPLNGDFDGDGKGDLVLLRNNSQWIIYKSSTNYSTFESINFGLTGDIPTPADFNGDGNDNPAVFRPTNGTWYYLRPDNATASIQFGANGDIPATGDYDGDGVSDYALYRPTNGVWYVFRSSNSSVQYESFGLPADKPVPTAYQP